MPKPSMRKNSAPPPRAKKDRATNSRPKKNGECSACGLKGSHAEGCPNSSCPECGMMAGSHSLECSKNPAIEPDELPLTKTLVDGDEAVIDGRTGGPKEQPLLQIADTDDAVLSHLARCVETEARLRTAANKAKNALSKAHKETEAAQQHAAEHYARSRQLSMDLTTGGTEPEDDE